MTPPFRYPSRDAFLEGRCIFLSRADHSCGWKSHRVHHSCWLIVISVHWIPQGSLIITEPTCRSDTMLWTCIYCGASHNPRADCCPTCGARFDTYWYFLTHYPWFEVSLRCGAVLALVFISIVFPIIIGIVEGQTYIGTAVAVIAGIILILARDRLMRLVRIGKYHRYPRAPRISA